MKLQDVFKFKDWEKHKSSLYADYNFDESTEKEIKDWFLWKTGSFRSKYFTIFLKDTPIGYLSFKSINERKKRAVLGIVIEPGKIEKGFGKEALFRMLKYYFYECNFEKLYLEVARYNKRAILLYKKMGFEKTGSFMRLYENGDVDFNEDENLKNCFRDFLGVKFYYTDKMVLYRNAFNEVVKCISS